MYLTVIDPKTGLLDISNERDGVLAIADFRTVIEDKELGLPCLTAVALTADYESIIKHYSLEDRPMKAMETVTGNRKEWVWNQEKIQVALRTYNKLQYNPVLEEGKIHYNRKIKKLKQIQDAEANEGKELPTGKEDGTVVIGRGATQQMFRELKDINQNIKDYEESIQGHDLYENAPSKGGYNLSRLEQLIDDKNSFYQKKR